MAVLLSFAKWMGLRIYDPSTFLNITQSLKIWLGLTIVKFCW